MADVRVCAYPNTKSLPLHAGIEHRLFERFGVDVRVHFTDHSRAMRDSLSGGACDVVHLAVDNAISMVDDDGHDIVIVAGGDSGMNELFVQPAITRVTDLRGKRLVVDAPDTAYALQAIKILRNNGLEPSRDYTIAPIGRGELRLKAMAESPDAAAAVLNPPYRFEAEDMGLKSLGSTVDLLGPYQAGGAFVQRGWAVSNRDTLERYLAGYIVALRWVHDPANHARGIELLADKLQLSREIAVRSHAAMVEPRHGLVPDAILDREGLANTLALRRETVRNPGIARTLDDYVDLSFHAKAMALANSG